MNGKSKIKSQESRRSFDLPCLSLCFRRGDAGTDCGPTKRLAWAGVQIGEERRCFSKVDDLFCRFGCELVAIGTSVAFHQLHQLRQLHHLNHLSPLPSVSPGHRVRLRQWPKKPRFRPSSCPCRRSQERLSFVSFVSPSCQSCHHRIEAGAGLDAPSILPHCQLSAAHRFGRTRSKERQWRSIKIRGADEPGRETRAVTEGTIQR